jgi:hypothetical protein
MRVHGSLPYGRTVAARAAQYESQGDVDMTVYMVDRDLPGVTLEALGAAQAKAISTAEEYQRNGRDVRYIRSTFVPGESHCMCLFEAASEKDVADLNDEAGIPYTRVTEALDLTP